MRFERSYVRKSRIATSARSEGLFLASYQVSTTAVARYSNTASYCGLSSLPAFRCRRKRRQWWSLSSPERSPPPASTTESWGLEARSQPLGVGWYKLRSMYVYSESRVKVVNGVPLALAPWSPPPPWPPPPPWALGSLVTTTSTSLKVTNSIRFR